MSFTTDSLTRITKVKQQPVVLTALSVAADFDTHNQNEAVVSGSYCVLSVAIDFLTRITVTKQQRF